MSDQHREAFLAEATDINGFSWELNLSYPPQSAGELMRKPSLLLHQDTTAASALQQIKAVPKEIFFTYAMVVNDNEELVGVLVMRDLILAEDDTPLHHIAIKNPLSIHEDDNILQAYTRLSGNHIPEYPVIDDNNRVIGSLRGNDVTEAYLMKISAQSSIMVGASAEENAETPIRKSIRYRVPWLLVNLLTAFIAGAVVGLFQHTIDEIALLAIFLPILAGQSGNTGAQSLAIMIRELSTVDMSGKINQTLIKEATLGLINGILTGVITAIIMFIIATMQHNAHSVALAIIIFISMTASCIMSGIIGAYIPYVLKKCGADPAAASSIFLTTGTDIISMGIMLYLVSATIL